MKEQTYKLLDGKATSAQIKQEIAAEVAARVAAGKKAPHLVAILVGHDVGSETYVAAKIKTCAEVGFRRCCYGQGRRSAYRASRCRSGEGAQ